MTANNVFNGPAFPETDDPGKPSTRQFLTALLPSRSKGLTCDIIQAPGLHLQSARCFGYWCLSCSCVLVVEVGSNRVDMLDLLL